VKEKTTDRRTLAISVCCVSNCNQYRSTSSVTSAVTLCHKQDSLPYCRGVTNSG